MGSLAGAGQVPASSRRHWTLIDPRGGRGAGGARAQNTYPDGGTKVPNIVRDTMESDREQVCAEILGHPHPWIIQVWVFLTSGRSDICEGVSS